jgi:hypothetical protein
MGPLQGEAMLFFAGLDGLLVNFHLESQPSGASKTRRPPPRSSATPSKLAVTAQSGLSGVSLHISSRYDIEDASRVACFRRPYLIITMSASAVAAPVL